ncbi:MAG: CDP-archaeol synthase [Candidatus Saccharimonadales bacterium]
MGDVVIALWFFVPVGFANMAPIVAANIPWLARFRTPMDFGRTFRGRRILGDNKTWRGLFCGMAAATLALWLQQVTAGNSAWLADFPGSVAYEDLPTLLLGPLFALGALGGDAAKSFVKRQMGAAAGKPWPFFDQIGEIVGGILVTLPFVVFGFGVYVWVIVVWVTLDLGISTLAYTAGWKERPW